MNPIMNGGSTPRTSAPTGKMNPDELSTQLRNLENQKLDLKNQISELKNNTNLDEELKKKQIEKLEEMVKALEEQIAALKTQQNATPSETEPTSESAPVDFSNLPNHKPDEFVKSDMLPHTTPTGRYEISQDGQGNVRFIWDKPQEDKDEKAPSGIE